jgi:hypothetical protein
MKDNEMLAMSRPLTTRQLKHFYGGTDEFWNKTFKLPDVELMT